MPAVDLAIPVAGRQWRRALHRPRDLARHGGLSEGAAAARRFDEIIDTQGLFFKSALVARYAHGRRHGYDARSIKEPPAVMAL